MFLPSPSFFFLTAPLRLPAAIPTPRPLHPRRSSLPHPYHPLIRIVLPFPCSLLLRPTAPMRFASAGSRFSFGDGSAATGDMHAEQGSVEMEADRGWDRADGRVHRAEMASAGGVSDGDGLLSALEGAYHYVCPTVLLHGYHLKLCSCFVYARVMTNLTMPCSLLSYESLVLCIKG
ncbi:hypothetical protein PVAP13_1KG461805 [Panicum virgatum]|uniref:Uncharacterized protein n=1 Tax=Panicum virgatum TaxID=38727 RepID=A0A8T0XRM7_PANVG|nr:hypothetical protein PVAP13_1KG461805 [Panicum virgatum]